MREVIEIFGTEDKVSKDGKKYKITHLLVDDGSECELFGDDIKQGDLVMIFFHKGKIKASKSNIVKKETT